MIIFLLNCIFQKQYFQHKIKNKISLHEGYSMPRNQYSLQKEDQQNQQNISSHKNSPVCFKKIEKMAKNNLFDLSQNICEENESRVLVDSKRTNQISNEFDKGIKNVYGYSPWNQTKYKKNMFDKLQNNLLEKIIKRRKPKENQERKQNELSFLQNNIQKFYKKKIGKSISKQQVLHLTKQSRLRRYTSACNQKAKIEIFNDKEEKEQIQSKLMNKKNRVRTQSPCVEFIACFKGRTKKTQAQEQNQEEQTHVLKSIKCSNSMELKYETKFNHLEDQNEIHIHHQKSKENSKNAHFIINNKDVVTFSLKKHHQAKVTFPCNPKNWIKISKRQINSFSKKQKKNNQKKAQYSSTNPLTRLLYQKYLHTINVNNISRQNSSLARRISIT